ncbi:PREDICTED: phosphatidylinositol 4-phosphate 5-kinase-like protein 1 isoform X4 [Chinchilla lanigera]|uniref:phosphatidylinositol 4-phosphate 5-kinase-like protein 1 isoform X4 n=1 Tax=Chinchilla lanigera TaxID=34839 RepID=UPI0006985E98|nr:PREDICTED: phosphatidylinositol 4-phosphate 5-kinase-like protein 1 isoform X4 [Chinchilla lanigera]
MLQPRGRDPQAITSAPLLGLGAAVTGAVRLVDCEAGAGPGSCNGATGDSAKAREAAAGAMAAPSPGPREALALSPEAGQRAATSNSSHRRGLFWRLRDKQTRLGLFEIGPRHELHGLASMMQAGLWAATQASIDHPPTPSDFSSELTSPKKPFLACCSQAPSPSFRAISLCWDRTGFRWPTCDRGHVPGLSSEPGAADPAGLPTQEDFSEVLTQVHEGFELGTLAGPAFARLRRSLGVAEEDYQAALGPGGPYLQFLSTSKSKASFFLSHDQRFFLKTQRRREVQVLLAHLPRYVQHLQRHPHSLLARLLEVLHHHAERLLPRRPHLREVRHQGLRGPQRSWLLRQMELDTTFLQELRVLDYSLLMAFQRLHDDERGQSGSVIFLVARSVHGAQIPEEAGSQNRRLLPDGPNALHVLDGPEHRYFLGLVDLATVYGLRKRLEHLWKTLRYPGRTFSTVSPACYARRLCQWVEAHTE